MSKHRGPGREGYRPGWEDYFPLLVRGHSLGTRRVEVGTRCTDEGCWHSKKGGGPHQDREVNIEEWKKERGLK